ncbi:MAG: phosphoribosylformylglycinamidine synthase I [Caldilineales bacterium]|nr:phosphoribosylformylglycinamidine synthase I [Caldilineales bacterium]MCW5860888.1 phosphoribosylformylglycinamidine synthase I [Caldilineales bacterium]
MTPPPIAILHAPGTNRDIDAAIAFELAGGSPEIVHINQLLAGERRLAEYALLVLPGGFSYGDDLGAGKLWAVRLLHELGDQLGAFAAAGKPIIGICNGFQVLVKTGLLPGASGRSQVASGRSQVASGKRQVAEPVLSETKDGKWQVASGRSQVAEPVLSRTKDGRSGHGTRNTEHGTRDNQRATLTRNESAQFECRWVWLEPNGGNRSPWLAGLGRIHCPVAHGEGNFVAGDDETLAGLQAAGLVAFTYVDAEGRPGPYPANPNGSAANIAGITNAAGNILGLMPHPEDHIFPWQHPGFHRRAGGHVGLKLFQNGIVLASMA